MKEGTIGNVRILDAAIVPVEPVAPRRARVLALALFLGLAGGIGLAFARRALDQGVEDPEALERATGIGVHASVAFSERQIDAERKARREQRRDPGPRRRAIRRTSPSRACAACAPACSSRCSSRRAASSPCPARRRAWASPSSRRTSPTCSARPASSVVVVDADLRRGHLHEYYGTRSRARPLRRHRRPRHARRGDPRDRRRPTCASCRPARSRRTPPSSSRASASRALLEELAAPLRGRAPRHAADPRRDGRRRHRPPRRA